jgi:hypothetical protein
LGGGDIDDLLSPYDCEIKPYRGVLTPAGWEMVPQGVFELTARNVVGDGQVQLTGQDRALIYQGGMPAQLAVSVGSPVEQAIRMLLEQRTPGLQMRTWLTGYTVGPLLYQADIDVWAEAQKLAQSVGGWLWHDREGYLHFGPATPISVVPHPALDPMDLVVVNRPTVGLVERTLAIQEIQLPLTARDAMTIQFRKYILTEDGQTIMTSLTVNS